MEKTKAIVLQYLEAWKEGDKQAMFDLCQKTWLDGKKLDDLVKLVGKLELKEFKLVSTAIASSVCHKFAFELYFKNGYAISVVINVICEIAPFKTATFGDWGVNPVSAQTPVMVLERPKSAPIKKAAQKKK